MTGEFKMGAKTFSKLEALSTKLETLANLADLLNLHVWQISSDDHTDNSMICGLTSLTETLAEIAHSRDKELEGIIEGISFCAHKTVAEGTAC